MAIITRTPRQLITSALKGLGVQGQSDDLENEQATDGLNALNEMLASDGVNRGMLYALDKQSYTLVAGTGSYTIGTGGTFDTERPVAIYGGYIVSGDTSYPLECFTRSEYNDISTKSSQSRPTELYYDPDYPLGKIYFDYTPSSADTLNIDVHVPIASVATLNTTIVLPPEYAAYIKWNLMLWIAPDYELNPRKGVVDLAESTRNTIINNNVEDAVMTFDSAIAPTGNTRMRTIYG